MASRCSTWVRSFASNAALKQHIRDSVSHPRRGYSTQDPSQHTQTNRTRPPTEIATSFMFPQLHANVVAALSGAVGETSFKKENSDHGSLDKYSTFVMGKFKCSSGGCTWSSKKVAILIRRYPNNGYNAVVFNQRCKACLSLGVPTLDEESYIERVVYRLKKWAGVEVESRRSEHKEGPPHRSELCEGCKQGYCRKGDDFDVFV